MRGLVDEGLVDEGAGRRGARLHTTGFLRPCQEV